jgi:hypothetical protein
MAALRQGQQWMIDIAHILDAPLPELDTPKPAAQSNQGMHVQRQLIRYLSRLKKQRGLSETLIKFRQQLIDITARWGDDLFVCYDIAGVPPTKRCRNPGLVAYDAINGASVGVSLTPRPCWTKVPI